MFVKKTNPLLQTVCLGVLAGMRTFSAPAITSYILSRNPSKGLKRTPFAFMQNRLTTTILTVLAVGELAGDKNPGAPNRTSPAGLIGRTISGALTGAAIYKAVGHRSAKGAFIGGITAVASTYASFELRKQVVKLTGYPDPYIGLTEDMLVVASAAALVTA